MSIDPPDMDQEPEDEFLEDDEDFLEDDDDFLDDDDDEGSDAEGGYPSGRPWRILLVDDEPGIHQVTKLAAADIRFQDRAIEFLSAYSGEEAQKILREEDGIALILLDVVMETDDAGLRVARWIRDDLKNHMVRIILRTGQPGQAPERDVITNYDINDYKAKTELTQEKLFTAIIGSLRNFGDIEIIEKNRREIEANRRGLVKIIDASKTIFRLQSVQRFADGVLEQMQGLVFVDHEALFAKSSTFAAISRPDDPALKVIAGTGAYADRVGGNLNDSISGDIREAINLALEKDQPHVASDHYVGVFHTESGSNVLAVEGTVDLTDGDRSLLDLYCRNVGVALDNILLREEIERTQRDIIYRLGELVETRSKETGNHVRRVAEYSYLLATLLGVEETTAERLRVASPLHDVGKVGIPDEILNKPGRFDADERAVMETHAEIGYRMLEGSTQPILKMAATIAYEHHEKWNGKGYPRGISGEEIDVLGRITAVADVFDALGSDRVYKKAWDLDRIKNLFREERGEHFDPTLIDLFFEHEEKFLAIRDKYQD